MRGGYAKAEENAFKDKKGGRGMAEESKVLRDEEEQDGERYQTEGGRTGMPRMPKT